MNPSGAKCRFYSPLLEPFLLMVGNLQEYKTVRMRNYFGKCETTDVFISAK